MQRQTDNCPASQTWEDPNTVHPETKAKGDNDPLDVCEIGELVGYPGQVKQVKVLGVMALLDEEETDWKVIVIDVNDPLAPKLNDVEDVERHLPGLLRATNEWFRIYKIPDGKPENQFAFTGECKNKRYASSICPVRDSKLTATQLRHGCHPRVRRGLGASHHRQDPARQRLYVSPRPHDTCHVERINRLIFVCSTNVTVQHSPSRVAPESLPPLPPHQDLPPEKIDASIDKWFFISGASA